jgi:hydrogenase maturation protein HypF
MPATGEQAVNSARRVRARVTGTVQGVGYRPFVYRLASELGLSGWVLNDSRGVLIDLEGRPKAIGEALRRLRCEGPPLATVEGVDAEELEPAGRAGFAIRASADEGEAAVPVSPDTATCPECLAEMRDPGDRRFRYPFVNCTNCGPRFTIVEGVPYDRPLTTMSGFEMCDECRREYEDPLDRRFHAQPNACAACGPSARFVAGDGARLEGTGEADALAAAAAALRAGAIVAVKGLGGYHLACRADDEDAVAALRSRKHREEKPFALMVAGLEAARELVELGEREKELLTARARPIVLAMRRRGAPVAKAVAPRAAELGLMLPYSGLHHLLAGDAVTPLVLTSGNVSDEPIAYEDADAFARLAPIADAFLTHDRPIHIRTDDSVTRAVRVPGGDRPLVLRRSRGHVPDGIPLPVETSEHLLACGAELKSTFCLAKGRRAWVGHHIGDLENYETLRSYRQGIAHFERVFDVEPRLCAHDLHPEYLSTKYALERAGVETVGVQHHHAHLAACLAEHGEHGPALGAIFDGTGYGEDGTIWGGEILFGGAASYERVGHLRPVPMPGGVAAIREPWRMACSWLEEALGREVGPPASLAGRVASRDWRNCARLAESKLGSPQTTSMGRLLDVVGVLCGTPIQVTYEGQAAIELEALADGAERGRYEMPFTDGVLDPAPALRSALAELGGGTPPPLVAARFHNTVAAATAGACERLAGELGTELVVLSGGVFQNRLLLERTAGLLAAAGLRPIFPQRLPPNDGGVSFGQATVAAALPGRG